MEHLNTIYKQWKTTNTHYKLTWWVHLFLFSLSFILFQFSSFSRGFGSVFLNLLFGSNMRDNTASCHHKQDTREEKEETSQGVYDY